MESEKQTQQEKKLRVPKFVKVASIGPGQAGFFVYCKVTKVTHSKINEEDAEGGSQSVVEGQVGDETGVVNIRIVGQYSKLVNEGNVIAIKNGRSEVFKENQRLEIDKFGVITAENGYKIDSVKTDNDLSLVKYEKKLVRLNTPKKR